MILVWLILILMGGGLLALFTGGLNKNLAKWISLAAVSINFIVMLYIWLFYPAELSFGGENWIINFQREWIPQFGISFHFVMDGLSMLMLLLTMFLGIIAVLVSWNEITEKIGFYYFNICWILAGITGVFLSFDLFLFYFFWEVMLVPMYFLIGIWGHENRMYAAYKFFIFTQASGLLMFLAILGLYFIHGAQTGIYTFDYLELLNTETSLYTAKWLMLGFLAAFIVKLPAVPFHSWLPDAHTQAPTAGSLILAGLLLKTGAYGLLRFVLPLFPEASKSFALIGMILGVIGILYGAKLAFAQNDLKRLIAYSSVSHMGFILLGVFAFNELALQGVVIQMIAHGVSTGALFIIAGMLQHRLHSRDIDTMSGFWNITPRLGGVAMVFGMASLGLPGLGNFVAEFLTLVGAYQANVTITVFATLGLIAATLYSLKIIQRIFHGPDTGKHKMKDLNARELVIMGLLIVVIVWIGLYPRPFLDTAKPVVRSIERVLLPGKNVVLNTTAEEFKVFEKN